MSFEIRAAQVSDAPAICAIYNHYINTTAISFEEQEVSEEEMRSRISNHAAHLPWLVLCVDHQVQAYAYATPWRARSAYRFSVESTVYVDHAQRGKAYGKALYRSLLDQLRQAGLRTVIGGIALPNPASIALHESLGFQKVAEFKDVGFKFAQWHSVGYWQLALQSA